MNENRTPKISVIMPVYNSEEFLRMAVDSILNQTFEDFELILVDDGSKDNSGAICDEYAQKDARVQVIHQENHGMCYSRNRALEIARGEYIMFSDNDDECLPGFFSENYALAHETNADMIKFGRAVEVVKDGKHFNRQERNLEKLFYTREDLIKSFVTLRDKDVFSPVWDGMYKTEIIRKNHIRFNEELRFGEEDTIFCLDMCKVINSFATNSGVYYMHYFRIGHSASSKFNVKALEKHIVSAEKDLEVYRLFHYIDQQWGTCVQQIVHKHLIPMLILFQHPNCNMTLKEKKQFLNTLKMHESFQFDLVFTHSNYWNQLDKKTKLFVTLFTHNHYNVLLFLFGIYYKLKK